MNLPSSSAIAAPQLRDYQAAAIRKVLEGWNRGDRRIMLQLPTGAGKTVVFSAIASELLQEGVLVIAHRQELIEQAAAKLWQACNAPVGTIKAGVEPNPSAPIQVASIQTLVRRNLPQAGLVIIDEAHHATARTYRRILESYPGSYILGVSATPVRTDGTGFDDLFDALVCGPSMKELIRDGYLSQFRLFADDNPISVKGIRKVAGDYNQRQLADSVDLPELSGDLIKSYLQYAPGKRNCVFAINREHSRYVRDRYIEAGIPAAHLDGETPDEERRDILSRFASGEKPVLCNVGIVTEGFDLPVIEVVQIAKPTASLVQWLQMVGRALRPLPSKEYAIILDHTTNWALHGRPDRNHIWMLEGVKADRNLQQRKNPQTGEIEEATEQEQLCAIERERSLQEILEDESAETMSQLLPLLRLKRVAQEKGYKPGWIAYRFLEMSPSLEALRVCAHMLGYHPRWALHKYQELQQRALGGAANA